MNLCPCFSDLMSNFDEIQVQGLYVILLSIFSCMTIETGRPYFFGTKFLIARYTPDAWRMRARPKKV
jgi:hypothetical protein